MLMWLFRYPFKICSRWAFHSLEVIPAVSVPQSAESNLSLLNHSCLFLPASTSCLAPARHLPQSCMTFGLILGPFQLWRSLRSHSSFVLLVISLSTFHFHISSTADFYLCHDVPTTFLLATCHALSVWNGCAYWRLKFSSPGLVQSYSSRPRKIWRR